MKRTLLASTVALLLGACADNRSSVEITGRAAPDDPTTCKFTAGGEKLLGPGVLDLAFAPVLSYRTIVYVQNNLIDPKDLAPEAVTDTKSWRATAARVRVNPVEYDQNFGASPALAAFKGENTIALDGQTTPPGGQSAQFIDVLSDALGAQLASAAALAPGNTSQVVFGITLLGQTLDGARIDSGEWYFPVLLCNGCLPIPTCPAGTALTQTNCYGVNQDSAPICK